MAEWTIAYEWMMDNEDASRTCAQVPDASPAAVSGPCFAISGINSGAFPAQFKAIAALPQAARKPLVERFYRDHFWNQWFERLSSDELCKRVFDFAVNSGAGTAVRCLHEAVNRLLPAAQGGEGNGWGPAIVSAANSVNAEGIVNASRPPVSRTTRPSLRPTRSIPDTWPHGLHGR